MVILYCKKTDAKEPFKQENFNRSCRHVTEKQAEQGEETLNYRGRHSPEDRENVKHNAANRTL